MSLERAKAHLRRWNRDHDVVEFQASTATVALAAAALNVDEGRIAKTLSFMGRDGPVLVVCAGDSKIDNAKFKQEFGTKASMLTPDQVRVLVGHEVGGVCPFGLEEGTAVYLDVSLRRFDAVYPACGNSNTCIRLTCPELEEIALPKRWVDVSKALPRSV